MAENRIDTQRPDAPELAAYGSYAVGVTTRDFTHEDQIDMLALSNDAPLPDPLPRTDRVLVTEIWYPAAEGATGDTVLHTFLRNGTTEIELQGRAMRDAAPSDAGPFPLVIVSHGYPGNRFLLSHLAENIASKGYVVASIDHQDSTYRDQAAFGSTLVNRPFDQIFVLDSMAALGASDDPLAGLFDADNAGLIGYSMGAYGAVITAGGGVTQTAVDLPWGAAQGQLAVHLAGSDSHESLPDPRIRTAVAIAPWGRQYDFWDAAGLSGIDIPMLFVAGSADDVSGYEAGTRQIWQDAGGTRRALLTFENANHNAAAPFPAPEEGYAVDPALGWAPFEHYADAVWDTARMNNIAQHFVTAWLDLYLKGDAGMEDYLDLVPVASDGVWSVGDDGSPTEDHTYWEGFPNRSAVGLRFEWLEPGE
ncbi:dienelactone hydrolase [Rhodobacterales bacterium HKCCE3408]|nr:dienelactone hydrolase [Rhodobacterales bacterium HKCCE3408]